MKRTVYSRLYDNLGKIGIFAAVIGAIVAVIILIVAKNIPLDENIKQDLYDKQALIEQDFSNIVQIEGANVETTDSEVRVTLKGENCELKLVYDKHNNCISEQLVDNRLGHPASFVAVLSVFSVTLGYLIAMIIVIVEGWRITHRKKGSQQKKNIGDNIS